MNFLICVVSILYYLIENQARLLDYSLKYETTFRIILEVGNLVLSNNLAERAIKSLVIGRKNWLFFQSFEGAQSSAIIMTLLETAKQNGLDSEKYINYLLTKKRLQKKMKFQRLICHEIKIFKKLIDKKELSALGEGLFFNIPRYCTLTL